jgi:hypothetical protein
LSIIVSAFETSNYAVSRQQPHAVKVSTVFEPSLRTNPQN